MLKRIVTALVSLAVFFAIVLPGNRVVFDIAAALITAGMLWEMFNVMRMPKLLWAVGYASAVLTAYGLYTGCVEVTGAVTMAAFLVTAVILHGKNTYKTVFAAAFSSYYITYFMMTLVWNMDKYGLGILFLPFICAWTTDTGAYFAGTFFGKHKLIPHVSPKKTVEGSVGGVVCCIICVYLYLLIADGVFHARLTQTYPVWIFAVIAAVASVLSQLGDLAASAIKRDCKAKDFGTIFPGHGGILDRFDSVLFTAPCVYYMIEFFSAALR